MYQGEGWLILSNHILDGAATTSVSRGGVVDSQHRPVRARHGHKCIKGRGG